MAEPLAPDSYAEFLADLESRIQSIENWSCSTGRLAAISSNGRNGKVGGAKVIDRLAADLKRAFPDMRGFSPRNLKYLRAFAEAWPEEAIVQAVLAQITW